MGSSVLTLQLMIVAVMWIEPDHIVDRIVAIDEKDGVQDYSRWSAFYRLSQMPMGSVLCSRNIGMSATEQHALQERRVAGRMSMCWQGVNASSSRRSEIAWHSLAAFSLILSRLEHSSRAHLRLCQHSMKVSCLWVLCPCREGILAKLQVGKKVFLAVLILESLGLLIAGIMRWIGELDNPYR